jgi:hypothetical protein
MTQNNVGIYASQISGHLYSGPYGAYDSLATVTVGSTSVASIDFSGIPQGYKHLQIRGIIQNTATSNSSGWLQCRANGDTAANYTYHFLSGGGSSASAGAGASQSAMLLGDSVNSGAGASTFAPLVIDILDYASTTKTKTFRSLTGVDTNSWGEIYLSSGLWNSTSPLTSLSFYTASYNLKQYSQLALYGVK